MDMDNFISIDGGTKFDIEDFTHFVRGRRSHRRFKDRSIPKKDLETLIDLCRYAPTGSNRQTLEIMVVQDREKINRLSNYTVDFFEKKIDWLAQEAEAYRAAGKEVPQIFTSALTMRDTLNLVVMARQAGFEVIFHQAPAVMIFHSPVETSTPKDDCVIASTTITLAARTMGLETCYIGLFEFAANTYEPVIEELGLPEGNKVFSVLILGYPALKFHRAVDRKPLKVQWA
jgi:nitroreductase